MLRSILVLSCCLLSLLHCPLVNATSNKETWQQGVSYRIEATLVPDEKHLTGELVVAYRNNSPNTLEKLVFELPQQLYRAKGVTSNKKLVGTKTLSAFIQTNPNTARQPLQTQQQQSFFHVFLPDPLHSGKKTEVILKWVLQIPSRLHPLRPRGGFEQINQDTVLFGLSEWYPRLIGYDEKHGWDTLPFRGKGEFHLEPADFNVAFTVPAKFLVLATGKATNRMNVLNNSQAQKLNQVLVQKTPVSYESKNQGSQTWTFRTKKQRDFTLVVGNNLVWEVKDVATSQGHTRVNVVYPNNGRWLWQKYALAAVEHSIKYLDSNLAPFPFSEFTLANIAGIGMEYPGLTFVGFRGPDSKGGNKPNFTRTDKYDVIGGTIHEVAHSYFPMLVNSNERREGFLDEGLASYLSYLIEQAWSPDFQSFYGAPKDVVPVMAGQFSAPKTLADDVHSKLDSHYHIPATAWNILGTQLIGQEKILQLLNQFVVEHVGQRVYFEDLVHFIEQRTQLSLREYFFDWFYSNRVVDMALDNVTHGDRQLSVTVSNLGGIEMPFKLVVILSNGKRLSKTAKYSQWQTAQNNKVTMLFELESEHDVVNKVELDPDQISADINRVNNLWFNPARYINTSRQRQ